MERDKRRNSLHALADGQQKQRAGAQIVRGEVVKATYHDQTIKEYVGNPLIEALPSIYAKANVYRYLASGEPCDLNLRRLPVEQRKQALYVKLLHFFEPLPVHADLEQRLSRMIRAGYLERNIASAGYLREQRRQLDEFRPGQHKAAGVITTAKGFSIIGLPGTGKTSSLVQILRQLYPQVIVHTEYDKRPFTNQQIVWLKLQCPSDGSLSALCKRFFEVVDALAYTSYREEYSGTAEDMVGYMARVASLHSLGVLVIDEIQDLSLAKSGGAGRMLNFFVQLVNEIGVPVLLVGTYKALPILGKEFRQIRRAGGQGEMLWDAWPQHSTEWKLLVRALWQHQYVRHEVALTQELDDTLYDLCQGVTDYAIKVFALAQFRAMDAGTERVTPALMRSAAKDLLGQAQAVLNALKNKNEDCLMQLEDVKPINLLEFADLSAERPITVGRFGQDPEVQQKLAFTAAEQSIAKVRDKTEDQTEVKSQLKPQKLLNSKRKPRGSHVKGTKRRHPKRRAA